MEPEAVQYIHSPVLLAETLQYLAPRHEDSLMIDATLGEGGHSYAFLSRFPSLRVIGIDADSHIQEVAKQRLSSFGDRMHYYSGWSHTFFAEYPSEIKRPDIILIDLGISLFHYEKSGRGFSFRKNEALDMRLDPSFGPSAAELIMQLSERDLANLIYQNGEERFSRRIAHAIVETRTKSRIETADMLASIIEKAVPPSYRHGSIHPATRTFQALRIAVNGELSRLESLLNSALHVLECGGRLGVITFHSLEDRIVKNFFREKNKDCTCAPEAPICTCKGQRSITLVSKKPIVPTLEEIKTNPPSRSAKLRVVEKVLEEDL